MNTPKQGPGRPRMNPAQHRTIVRVFLTPAEKATFTEAAKLSGKTLSAWMRGLARRAAPQAFGDTWSAP